MSDEPAIGKSSIDTVIEVYKRDVDRALLRENLRLTPDQRLRKLIAFLEFAEKLRVAGREAKSAR
jgi:hypothetical protein